MLVMVLSVFVIDVIFRSEKHWGSFDIGEWEFADDGNANMSNPTHDRIPL